MPLDFLDLVANQGAFLVNRPSTPLPERRDHDEFAAELCSGLHSLLRVTQPCRVSKYGEEAAADWPMGHTPPELREEYRKRMTLLKEQWDLPSPSTDSDEERGGGEAAKNKADLEKCQHPADAAVHQDQVQQASTPIPSANNATSNTPRSRKRRRASDPAEEETAEAERPTKTRVTIATATRASQRLRRLYPRRSARLAGRSVGGNAALPKF